MAPRRLQPPYPFTGSEVLATRGPGLHRFVGHPQPCTDLECHRPAAGDDPGVGDDAVRHRPHVHARCPGQVDAAVPGAIRGGGCREVAHDRAGTWQGPMPAGWADPDAGGARAGDTHWTGSRA